MEIEVLGADSLGVRSMCIRAVGKEGSVVIDPGAALGPYRFGLPPSPAEERRLEETRKAIERAVSLSDAVVVSHYHYDHHSPERPLFHSKKTFLKDPENSINKSQRERAAYLISLLDEWDVKYDVADGRDNLQVGDLSLSFSPPMPHGPQGTRLGYVIMTAVTEGNTTVVHTSDIEGLLPEEGIRWIEERKPDIIFADGPPTYLLGHRFSSRNLGIAVETMKALVENTGAVLVLDHHLLRDLGYRKRMNGLFEAGKNGGKRVITMAGFSGMEEDLLEARRKELWKEKGKGRKGGKGGGG
ncbi:MAG: hypothetical protein J7L61_01535 [Thermoplasmata archaeon]|nr:hypothetical protein [Thermoplasmata archaeon]